MRQKGFEVGSQGLQAMLDDSLRNIERAGDTNGLLLEEAALTKKLFKLRPGR